MKNFWLILLVIILFFGSLYLYNCATGKKNNSPTITSTGPSSESSQNQVNSDNTGLPSPSASQKPTITISGDFTSPIMMYHYIRINPDPADQMGANLSVTPTDFAKQIKYLRDNDYEIVNLNQVLVDDGKKKAVATFDDGYKDVLENAMPALKENNATGTVFIIVNKVGTGGYLSWDDIRTLKNTGWEIGSHTLNHPNLTQVDTETARQEITESKAIIEKEIGTTVESFCYPAGRYNEDTINMVRDAGYKYATTTVNGFNNSTNDLLELSRIRVNGSDGLSGFEAKTP